jgi:hypothetical protein
VMVSRVPLAIPPFPRPCGSRASQPTEDHELPG